MKPIDFRTATWESIQKRLAGLRLEVHQALELYGPCTTRQLAAASGIDILSVRPRVTELVEMGYAECTGGKGNEGTYAARSEYCARMYFQQRQGREQDPQMQLSI